MQSIIMLIVGMQSVAMQSDVMLSVIMLNVIMMNVIMLGDVVMLSTLMVYVVNHALILQCSSDLHGVWYLIYYGCEK